MPLAFNAPTWSFISEMSGDTMTAIPSITNADIWKHNDLPPPVGISTSESPPPTVCRIISSCIGRNVSYPKYDFSVCLSISLSIS